MTCKRKIDVDLQRKFIKTCMPLNSSVLPKYDGKCSKMYSKLKCMQA